MIPRPHSSLIILFLWGNVFRVLYNSPPTIVANKPICKLGTVCLPELAVLLLVLFDITCFLMSSFWVAHESYCSSETIAGVSNDLKVKVLGKGPCSRGREGVEGGRPSWNHSQDIKDC